MKSLSSEWRLSSSQKTSLSLKIEGSVKVSSTGVSWLRFFGWKSPKSLSYEEILSES